MDFSTFFLKIPIIFLYTFEFYFVINSYYYDISIQYYEFYFAEFCDFFLFFLMHVCHLFFLSRNYFQNIHILCNDSHKKRTQSQKRMDSFTYISNSMRLARQNFHPSFLAWSMKTILYNPFVCLQYDTHKPHPLSNGI